MGAGISMNRLFVCGITSNETEKISELISRTKDHVDGYVWCVDSNSHSDETHTLLEKYKGEGKIVRHPWVCAHDWQANEWLHCGIFQDGDWILMLDSSEMPTPFLMEGIKDRIRRKLIDQDMFAMYASGRPYIFKYSEYLFFQGTPHWGLYGFRFRALAIPDEEKKLFIDNLRDLNPAKHYQEHDTKYYLYGRSNIIDAFYGKYGQKIVDFHEGLRMAFRAELTNLGYRTTLPQLETYFRNGVFSDFAKQVIEVEFCLSEYYRRVILGEDFMKDIVAKRERWSFQDHIKIGNGFANPDYLGTRLRYDQLRNK
jgi:hypothetical protein